MQYVPFGTTGLHVSQLCFGTMSFGGDADETTSKTMFHQALDAGINFFDSANVYQDGLSETLLGKFMAGKRDELVIATKAHYPTSMRPNDRGLSRRHLIGEVEKSLKRLNTDRIDVYYFHGFDKNTPMEESLRAMETLVQQGKILYPAVSNWSAWQTMKALGITRQNKWAPISAIQPMYNLVKRQAEVEILPLAQSEGLAVVPYSPLGGGILTGKYSGQKVDAEKGRIGQNKIYKARYGESGFFETADQLVSHAKEKGIHTVSLAIAWVMANPGITAPIIGARNPEQLAPALKSVDVPMTEAWRQEIAGFSPEPPPATDRTEERQGLEFRKA